MEKGRLWDLADLGEMANFQREARSPPLASAGEHACARVHMNALLVNRIWCHPQFQAYCQCLGRQPPPLSEGDGYNWIAPPCGGSVSSKVTEGDLADCLCPPRSGSWRRTLQGWREPCCTQHPCADSRPRKVRGCKHLKSLTKRSPQDPPGPPPQPGSEPQTKEAAALLFHAWLSS